MFRALSASGIHSYPNILLLYTLEKFVVIRFLSRLQCYNIAIKMVLILLDFSDKRKRATPHMTLKTKKY